MQNAYAEFPPAPRKPRSDTHAHMPHRGTGDFDWNDARWRMVCEYAMEGLSARAIAERLGNGCTRAAVIGKCFRMGHKLSDLHEIGRDIRVGRMCANIPEAASEMLQPAPEPDADSGWKCRQPGCRNTRVASRRGFCSFHESRYLDDQRAARLSAGNRGHSGVEIFTPRAGI